MRQLRFTFLGTPIDGRSNPLKSKRERKRRRGSGVPHDKREDMNGWVHVTVKLRRGLPSLRNRIAFDLIEEKFRLVKERFGCGLMQFSVLANHMHFLIRTEKTADLSRYMQGLQIRLAKALNKLWGRRGSVFLDRFFATLCDTKAKIRSATRYVLNNARRHGIPIKPGHCDGYSSARYYIHWVGDDSRPKLNDPTEWPIIRPAYGEDFYHYPLLNVDETPGWVVRNRHRYNR